VAVTAPYFLETPPPPPPRPYGIFDVGMGPMPFPVPQVESFGLLYVPDDCVSDTFLYGIQCPPVSGSKTFSAIESPVTGAPFAVITSYTCSAVGYSLDEAEQRVRTRMSLREQMAVERRLWQGQLGGGSVLGNIPGLFRGANSLGTAACVTEATEMLEQALATNGVIGGILHARWGMNSHMANSKLLLPPGALSRGGPRAITTHLGTPINFGQGYDGTGPSGELPTTDVEYMYASGRVLIWQDSEVVVPPARQVFNQSTNVVSLLAERAYAVAVECGVWSVAVTRNCTTAT
jgi:hypothetical protein